MRSVSSPVSLAEYVAADGLRQLGIVPPFAPITILDIHMSSDLPRHMTKSVTVLRQKEASKKKLHIVYRLPPPHASHK